MRRNKYNAVKTSVDDRTFDSKAEGRRYAELRLLEKAGEITNLVCQPKYKFSVDGRPVRIRPSNRQATFTLDFSYFCKRRNAMVFEDVKGGKATMTEAYKLRRAFFETFNTGVQVVEVGL